SKQIAYPENAAVLEAERTAEEERMARRVEKECAAAQLSAFALEPSRGTLPNPSNPYSDENYAFFCDLLEKRTKPSRFKHSLAVADTCVKMAEAYGLDIPQARIAGLLHDWDKSLNYEALVRRVSQYSLDIDADVVAGMPWILHGPTAAAVLRDQYPVLRTPVFQSIERHTVGAPDMAPLDMVVFCADKLEPGHKVAVYRELYEQIGILSLEDLFFQVLKEGLVYVLDSGLPLNRDSVAVWNWYIEHLL
ncbi:MAG: bis(5'-nucleosyl)-tetraphosphatase (symmetrical) YqeK, partial [Coriobacteriia bacterium]|nr:bis(5'-nucleosyl)-tetraphosphatase (symmetrical) YqeK [Coriobacteriia bacterium]